MTGVIVLKDKNQMVPDQYWEKVLVANKSASGFAFAHQGRLEHGSTNKVDTLKEIQEMFEVVKEHPIVSIFMNSTSPVAREDLQPFVILEDESKTPRPVLVAFIEGDFNSYKQTDSAHTNEYHLVNKLLLPKAKQLYRLVGQDIAKFMLEIADPVTQEEFLNATVPCGTITLLASNGAIFSFEKNDRKGKFPWGWTSNTYEYVEKSYPAKEEGGTMSALRAKIMGSKPEAKPEPASIVPAKATSVPAVALVEQTAKLGAPPKEVQGKGAIKKWYRNNAENGVLPSNWHSRPEVPLKKGPVKSFKDIVPTVASVTPIVPIKPKDVEPKHVVVDKPQHHQVPIIPAEHVKEIIDKFLKTVDTNSQEIIDPKYIQSLEDKLPTFTQKIGYKGLEETFRWSFKTLVELGEISKEALAMLCMQYRTAYILTLSEKPADEKVEIVEPSKPAQTKRGFKIM